MKTKTEKVAAFDNLAQERDNWRRKNAYYHDELLKLLRFLVPAGSSVLEVGCATGELLSGLKPGRGVGVDFSPEMVRIARQKHPDLEFAVDDAENLQRTERFDYVVLSDLIGELTDVWQAFSQLRKVTDKDSRLVITYYNYLWEPMVRLAERIGLKMPQDYQNWLSLEDIEGLLRLNGYEVVKQGYRLLMPFKVPFVSAFLNRYVALLPFFKKLCIQEYVVAREIPDSEKLLRQKYRVSVIIPTRNERGNIEGAVERLPEMGSHTELIFVDGASTDGTVEAIEEMRRKYAGTRDIRLIHQIPPEPREEMHRNDLATPPNKMLKLGKGDAVRKGFDAATGDILMILDSDLTVPPEDLPKFYQAIASGRGEFINGTRLVYQMEEQAMRTLNLLGNKFFSLVFTWLLEQRIKDTLCGTKVLFKRDYERIMANRAYFGDFDPFGDFDLLFGAAKLNLKIVEVPIRYRMRTYGDIKIERFKHGLILLRMSMIAFKKLKLLG